jgi:hypothetical protein
MFYFRSHNDDKETYKANKDGVLPAGIGLSVLYLNI